MSSYREFVRIRVIGLFGGGGVETDWRQYCELEHTKDMTKWSHTPFISNSRSFTAMVLDSRQKEFLTTLGEMVFEQLPNLPGRIVVNDELTDFSLEYRTGQFLVEH